jgi:beta-carotene 15,15'-dioxygenase
VCAEAAPDLSPAQRAARGHRLFGSGLAGLALAVAWLVPSSALPSALPWLVGGVLLLGLPHGAMDWWVGRHALQPRLGRRWWLPFLVAYLALVGLTAWGWVVAPVLSLGVFLLLSWLHFGSDLPSRGRWAGLAVFVRGGAPLVLPALSHPAEVSALFASWIGGAAAGPSAASVTQGLGALAWPWLLAFSLWVGRAIVVRATLQVGGPGGLELLELTLLAGMFLVLEPLPAFVLFFCGVHSVRHALELWAADGPRAPRAALGWYLRESAPATLAAVVLAVGVLLWLGRGGALEPWLVPLVFWGLSALTVPHMLLNAWVGASALGRVERSLQSDGL